jgi:hypothetical protein
MLIEETPLDSEDVYYQSKLTERSYSQVLQEYPKQHKLQQKTAREWFKKQARSASKIEVIPQEYTMTKTEIVKEVQIEEMFDKLDADHSKALDMQEM